MTGIAGSVAGIFIVRQPEPRIKAAQAFSREFCTAEKIFTIDRGGTRLQNLRREVATASDKTLTAGRHQEFLVASAIGLSENTIGEYKTKRHGT
jgi:hypothetical protein